MTDVEADEPMTEVSDNEKVMSPDETGLQRESERLTAGTALTKRSGPPRRFA